MPLSLKIFRLRNSQCYVSQKIQTFSCLKPVSDAFVRSMIVGFTISKVYIPYLSKCHEIQNSTRGLPPSMGPSRPPFASPEKAQSNIAFRGSKGDAVPLNSKLVSGISRKKREKDLDKWSISKRSRNQDLFSLPKCIWIKLKIDLRPYQVNIKQLLKYGVGISQQSHRTFLDIILYKIMCYAYLLSKHICELLGKRAESPGFISASHCTVVLAARGSLMATTNLFQTILRALGQRRQWTIVNLHKICKCDAILMYQWPELHILTRDSSQPKLVSQKA